MIKIYKKLLDEKSHYFLACSMGVDSVAALFWLKSKGYNITPLHFNHNLRAQNGTMHEKFLEVCRFLNIEGKSEIGINLNTEADCRNARLNFYARATQNGTIITAHHLNDWVESYILNCFRGHPHHTPIEFESQFENFKIIHPFLQTRKKDFRQFLERNNYLRFVVEDQSNFTTKGSRRNWVRNVIIPEMTKQKFSLEKYAKRKINKIILEKEKSI
jgi:tRNA(Ile)-lysidine synthetase-like protein